MQLSNADLAPVPLADRHWNTWNYAALWIGMSVCIPTYTLASGLIDKGMSATQAVGTVLLGNLVVLVPMLLNGHAGAKYGIPFPVFARAAFGVAGANVPAMLRAVIACGWFGINSWYGGTALWVVLQKLVWGHDAPTRFLDERLGFGAGLLHVTTGDFACFLAFWTLNMAIVWWGIEGIKKLLVFKSVFLPAATLALLAWAYQAANASSSHGFGDMLDKPSRLATTKDFLKVFAPGLTGMVGFWSTLSLNIPDFTRYAKSQKAQVVGQAIALPTSMAFVAFVGVAVTSATATLAAFHYRPEWNPIGVVQHFESALVVAIAMFCIALSTLATNIAANIVSPANDFANLAPRAISFRVGGLITGVVGIFMLPWKLVENPDKYINGWLVGYSGLLGPIAGILIVDYFLVRRTALAVDELYSSTGRYRYRGGWNLVALGALLAGIAPSLPGFLVRAQVLAPSPSLELLVEAYDYAWFVGGAVSAVLYWIGTKVQGSDAMRDVKPTA